MFEFVIEQVGNDSMEERWVGKYIDWTRTADLDPKPLVTHGRLAKVDHAPHKLVEIYLGSRKPDCIGFGLRYVERRVQKFAQTVRLGRLNDPGEWSIHAARHAS